MRYYVILPIDGYSGNVDIYSLSLQRYEIRYCEDLTFLYYKTFIYGSLTVFHC